jgi:putative copper resistance protein D
VAGGILWAGGEFVSVTMLAVLVVQWMRQSEREARRVDRELDRQEAAAAAAAAAGATAADRTGTIGGQLRGGSATTDDRT